jgi:hypothetical protein
MAVDGTRSALIVASDAYTDPGLRQLRAPASDAQALAAVLEHPEIGGFQVRTLLNQPAHEVNLAVEEFFADRKPDDLLLVHVSCHGIKDEDGELYFAATNTRLRRLGATAVAAEFVNRRMSRTRSRRVVLLLDCCYAGAFERGMTTRAGTGMGIEEQFGGRGRAVITASSAMEYAFEGEELADARGASPSVFTSALVEGLESGEADRDQDGMVALGELYDYVYDKVRATTPNQTPGRWMFGVEGDLYVARRSRPVTTPAPLPPELQEAIDSPLTESRAGAVKHLARLLQSRHAGRALAARLALERLSEDDSRMVCAAAAAALGDQAQPPVPPIPVPPIPLPPKLQLSETAIDFGQLAEHSKSPEGRVRLGNAGGGILNARAVTQASWLKIHRVGDELVVGVDTTAVGQHDDVINVDSDGGSSTIHVRAGVSPTPLPAAGATAATRSEVVPEMLEHEPPEAQKDAVGLDGLRATKPVGPPVAEPERPRPAAGRADRRLRAAGGLAILGAALQIVGLFPAYRGGFPLVDVPGQVWSSLIAAGLFLGAGICTLIPSTSRLVGPGLLLGAGLGSPAWLWTVANSVLVLSDEGAGLWIYLVDYVMLVLATFLAGLALARTGEVRVVPRSHGSALPWLMALLGVAGAVAFLYQFHNSSLGRYRVGVIWVAAMAFVVPACAAVVVPRRFGVALVAGWIGFGASLFIAEFFVEFADQAMGRGPLVVFGCVLLALLLVMIPFARAAPTSEGERAVRS